MASGFGQIFKGQYELSFLVKNTWDRITFHKPYLPSNLCDINWRWNHLEDKKKKKKGHKGGTKIYTVQS